MGEYQLTLTLLSPFENLVRSRGANSTFADLDHCISLNRVRQELIGMFRDQKLCERSEEARRAFHSISHSVETRDDEIFSLIKIGTR